VPTDDYEMTYTLPHEAWYAPAVRATQNKNETRWINVVKVAKGGGCDWEFTIAEVRNIGIQVRMYDDSWGAFDEVAGLFEGLAGLAPNAGRATFEDVVALLNRLGCRDITQRDAPPDVAGMNEVDRLRAEAVNLMRQADELDKGRVTAMAEVSD